MIDEFQIIVAKDWSWNCFCVCILSLKRFFQHNVPTLSLYAHELLNIWKLGLSNIVRLPQEPLDQYQGCMYSFESIFDAESNIALTIQISQVSGKKCSKFYQQILPCHLWVNTEYN